MDFSSPVSFSYSNRSVQPSLHGSDVMMRMISEDLES